MRSKRIFAGILSAMLISACGIGFFKDGKEVAVEARLIESEVIYSKEWTTSYYVQGTGPLETISGYYPYLQHRVDVYNDGTMKYIMWNSQEWDSFVYDPASTVYIDQAPNSVIWYEAGRNRISWARDNLNIEIPEDFYTQQTKSINTGEVNRNGKNINSSIQGYFSDFEFLTTVSNLFNLPETYDAAELLNSYGILNGNSIESAQINFSNIPINNNYWIDKVPEGFKKFNSKINENFLTTIRHKTCSINYDVNYLPSNGSLSNLSETKNLFDFYCTSWYYSGQLYSLPTGLDNPIYEAVFYPINGYPTEGINTEIMGNEIQVSSELLLPNTTQVERSWLEARVRELESENTELNDKIETIMEESPKIGDEEGFVRAIDAQNILTYYAESITENVSGEIKDYNAWLKEYEEE